VAVTAYSQGVGAASWKVPYTRPAFVLIGMVLMLLTGGCSDGAPNGHTAPPAPSGSEAFVTVKRGTVVSVVTANGYVLPTPEYVLLSKVAGRVSFEKAITEGKVLAAGAIVARQSTEKLPSPTAGVFVRRLVDDGMLVEAGIPVAVLRYGGFGVHADLPAAQAFRMFDGPVSARAQVTGGPGPAACTIVESVGTSAGANSGQTEPAAAAPLTLTCLLEAGTRARAGLPAVVAINTGERANVLVVPARAVAGDAESGTVARIVGGRPVETRVKLGISDGVNVEIVSGVSEGDQLLPYGPNLRLPVQ
jgi:multidrug efflux pump subunit AcrA (membrane-fusion protein)